MDEVEIKITPKVAVYKHSAEILKLINEGFSIIKIYEYIMAKYGYCFSLPGFRNALNKFLNK